jgi:V/A-type H+/Na+-transporting ATPase subunit I
MFYSRAMTEIELIIPAKDLLAVTKTISGQGIFHQIDSAYLSSGKESTTTHSWQEKATAYSSLERRIQSILLTLNIDEGMPPKSDFETMIDLETVRPTIDGIEQEVKRATEQLAANNKKIEQIEGYIHQLEPVADIEVNLSGLHAQHQFLFSMLGTIPTANIERLQTSLSRIPFVFLPLRQDPHNSVVWLAGTQNNTDILDRAARSAYLNPLILPEDYQGTPAEVIKLLQTDREVTVKNIDEGKSILAHLGEAHKPKLQALLWDVRGSRLLTDAIVHYGQLRYTYVIVGWAPTDIIETFTQKVKQASKEALIETYPIHRADVKQDTPVALFNPRLLRPFQLLVTTYARPLYGEVDPTPLIAVVFPFLFGAMFGDVGQGLVLAGLGWLLTSRRVKSLRGMAGLGPIIIACGLMATLFGFLYSSIFGYEGVLPVIWMEPTKNIMTILIIAIAAGVLLLTLGFLISIFNAFKIHDWGKMLFDHYGIAGLMLYLSLVGLAAGFFIPAMPVSASVFVPFAIIGGVAVMLSELLKHLVNGHRPLIEEGIGTFAFTAFFELFETMISFLSNSLSFVRVGAFAVAHGTLSAVFFILAELVSPGHGIGYWIVFLIGNVFIVGFEGLIVGIQTMRLSYYEIFGKFFTGGGKRFEPLTLRPSENE